MLPLERFIPKKNPLLLGFAISLLGSLPLGFTNVINLQILVAQGSWASFSFILGIVFIQYFVLRIVSKIAQWLVRQTKIVLLVEIFTVLFLFLIGFYFLNPTDAIADNALSQFQLAQYPFLLALFLNTLNFIQWPYWAGIFSYLYKNEFLNRLQHNHPTFIIGVMSGTAFGMLVFAHVGRFLLVLNQIQIGNYINPIFSVLFLSLATVQGIKLLTKYKAVFITRISQQQGIKNQ